MANKKDKEKAKRMAEKGKSAERIQEKTGVSASNATRLVEKKGPSSSSGGGGSGGGGGSSGSKKGSIKKALKGSKDGGISRKELKSISGKKGKNDLKIIKRLDAMNKSGEDIRLNSGAANYLYKKLKDLNPYDLQSSLAKMGDGNYARNIRGMIGDPGSPGVRTSDGGMNRGIREGTPGTGPMMGGTQLRPGGRPVISGFGDNNQKEVKETPDAESGPDSIIVGGSWDPSTRTPGDIARFRPNQDQGYLDLIAQMGDMFASQMGAYEQQIASQMDLLNQFAMPEYQEPVRMYGAGRNYNIEAVRAAQRDQKRRSGYLRGMGISGSTYGAPALSSGMSIGSALTTPGGVTI